MQGTARYTTDGMLIGHVQIGDLEQVARGGVRTVFDTRSLSGFVKKVREEGGELKASVYYPEYRGGADPFLDERPLIDPRRDSIRKAKVLFQTPLIFGKKIPVQEFGASLTEPTGPEVARAAAPFLEKLNGQETSFSSTGQVCLLAGCINGTQVSLYGEHDFKDPHCGDRLLRIAKSAKKAAYFKMPKEDPLLVGIPRKSSHVSCLNHGFTKCLIKDEMDAEQRPIYTLASPEEHQIMQRDLREWMPLSLIVEEVSQGVFKDSIFERRLDKFLDRWSTQAHSQEFEEDKKSVIGVGAVVAEYALQFFRGDYSHVQKCMHLCFDKDPFYKTTALAPPEEESCMQGLSYKRGIHLDAVIASVEAGEIVAANRLEKD